MNIRAHDETVLSLLGQPLPHSPLPAEVQQRAEAQLVEAQAQYERDPSLEHTIWYGRRAAFGSIAAEVEIASANSAGMTS
jgi:hypothetical protein